MRFGLIELIVAVSLLCIVASLAGRYRIIAACEARGGEAVSTNTFVRRGPIKCYDRKTMKEL